MIKILSLIFITFLVIPFVKSSELKAFKNNYSPIEGKVNDFHFDHPINKRAIFYNNLTNWTSPILFHVDSSLSYYRHIISSVVRGLSRISCLQFEESRTSIEGRIGVVFKYHHSICFSTVGRDPSVKNSFVYFNYKCAENHGYIIHELLHVLGLRHEHTRFDRDHFITINDDNVRDNEDVKKNIHEKDQNDSVVTHEDIPYDYGSILHYPRYAFIKWPGYETDGRYNTIEAKNIKSYTLMLGQNEKPSFNDIKALNYYYCSEKCKDSMVQCKNGGYKNYDERLCGRCVCPKGYYGNDCGLVKSLSEKCSKTNLVAKFSYDYIEESGNKNCNYRIKVEPNKTIHIALSAKTRHKKVCAPGVGLEVKYLENKGTTGLCLCGDYDNINIVSENNEIYLEFNGLQSSDEFQAYYALAPSNQENSIICDKDSCYEKIGNYYDKVNKTYEIFSYGIAPEDYPTLSGTEESSN